MSDIWLNLFTIRFECGAHGRYTETDTYTNVIFKLCTPHVRFVQIDWRQINSIMAARKMLFDWDTTNCKLHDRERKKQSERKK